MNEQTIEDLEALRNVLAAVIQLEDLGVTIPALIQEAIEAETVRVLMVALAEEDVE